MIPAGIILQAASAFMGLPWSSDTGSGLSRDTFRLLTPLLQMRLREIWRMQEWPECINPGEFRTRIAPPYWNPATAYANEGTQVLCASDWNIYETVQPNVPAGTTAPSQLPAYWVQRTVPTSVYPPYDPTSSLSQGDIVTDLTTGLAYYNYLATAQALPPYNTGTGNVNPGWHQLAPFDLTFQPTVAWQANTLGDVLRVCSQNPERYSPCTVDYGFVQVPSGGVRLIVDLGAAWFRYRLPVPLLWGDLWDPTVAYLTGSQVYYSASTGIGSGDYYNVIVATAPGDTPVSAPSKFAVVVLPDRFANWLPAAIAAHWLRAEGQWDKAAEPSKIAKDELTQLVLQLQRTQQLRRLAVETRYSHQP